MIYYVYYKNFIKEDYWMKEIVGYMFDAMEFPTVEFLNKLEELRSKYISFGIGVYTDEMFEKVHGEIRLHYTVYLEKNIVLLTNITPEEILDEGHRSELETYKGVMISKSNPKKDMFKVNLLNMLQK